MQIREEKNIARATMTKLGWKDQKQVEGQLCLWKVGQDWMGFSGQQGIRH
jgi:hypothetical protein